MIPNNTYPAAQTADLLEVTTRRLQQLVTEGAIPKPAKRGQYNLVATVHGYINFLRDRAAGKASGYAFEKERLTRLQADTAKCKSVTESASVKTKQKLNLSAIAIFQFPQPKCCKQQLLSLTDGRLLPGGRNWPDRKIPMRWIIRCMVFSVTLLVLPSVDP